MELKDMKNILCGYDTAAERLAPGAMTPDEKARIFAKAAKKAGLSEGHQTGDTVSGVEPDRRTPRRRYAGMAAALLLVSAAVFGGAYLLRRPQDPNKSIPALVAQSDIWFDTSGLEYMGLERIKVATGCRREEGLDHDPAILCGKFRDHGKTFLFDEKGRLVNYHTSENPPYIPEIQVPAEELEKTASEIISSCTGTADFTAEVNGNRAEITSSGFSAALYFSESGRVEYVGITYFPELTEKDRELFDEKLSRYIESRGASGRKVSCDRTSVRYYESEGEIFAVYTVNIREEDENDPEIAALAVEKVAFTNKE